ncbi:MAG: hypothetical protein H6654_01555 [Ardenticatenaceae bacterium]|nr:hypothetical protein [Anaerolineales bacterium]MCB8940870.1 hypothetical protein [Ardenticatenaceae bacterium]MCB8972209.1 hypothetical protein [Ardenticatenaceae bacterium]
MNLFNEYVENSQMIQENLDAIAAREKQRQQNQWGYTADMDNLKDDLQTMQTAFKDIVYRFATTLPSGWRVIGDFNKWLKGEACAGFVHGGMQPDQKLMIGGQCKTALAIEHELERLHQFVWQTEA